MLVYDGAYKKPAGFGKEWESLFRCRFDRQCDCECAVLVSVCEYQCAVLVYVCEGILCVCLCVCVVAHKSNGVGVAL